MERIFNPVSGEVGYFCTESEKILIDAIVGEYKENQLLVTTAPEGRGRNE